MGTGGDCEGDRGVCDRVRRVIMREWSNSIVFR